MSKSSQAPIRRGGGHGPGGMMPGSKAKNFKGSLLKLIRHLSPYKVSMIIVIIFATLSAVFSIIAPKIIGEATSSLFSVTLGVAIDFTYIGKLALWLIAIYLLSSSFMLVQGYVIAGVSQKVSYKLRQEISEKINRLPLRYFDKQTHGEILSRITNDVDTVSQTLQQSLSQIVTSVTTIVGVLVMMFYISVQMTVVAIISLPVSLALVMVIVKLSQKHFKRQQALLGDANGHIEEMYSGHNIIKAFNMEEKSNKKLNSINDELYESAWKANFLSGLMMPLMGFVGNLSYVAVSVLGGYLTVKKALEVGDIASFVIYVRQFNQPIMQTANIANILQSTVAASERVFEFLEEEEEVLESTAPVKINEVLGEVTFENVFFGYDKDKTIIKDISLHVKPGERIAIVGPTGAGKTTIVNLLMRFYDVDSGAIKVDGVDIRDMRRSDLRSLFGMVLQDTWLFGGTIRENLLYGRLDATIEEMYAAAKSAHAEHFINTLPQGYEMEINEEASNISQGQKQLLTIARAILADPPILILDEATSSVDTRTEIRIQRAMNNLMKGRTSFIIAHRLSTIRDADLILVMSDGNIIEQGKHDELLEAKGFYEQLYNSQFSKQQV